MSITTWGKKNKTNIGLSSEVIRSLSLKLDEIRAAEKASRHSSRRETDTFPGSVRFRRLFSFPKPKSKGLPALINLTLPSLAADHTQRRCQGRKFRPHHYLLLTMFIQASSVGGNRWCAWQVFNTGQRSAWLRVQTERTRVSTVKSKHVRKREEFVKWLKGRRFRSCLEKSLRA